MVALHAGQNDASASECWRFFKEDLGSPRYVAAPMVGASELPFRLLLRSYGFHLCWTPMLHAEEYAGANAEDRFRQGFATCKEDHPLIVQFSATCAGDFLEAACAVQESCVAVDLNLGCPQSKALKGGWGGALMDEDNWHVARDIVSHAVNSPRLRVPVTCKIRIFADERKSVSFARMLEEAGCSMLTVHGRQRCRELHHAPANWSTIRAIRKAVRIPVVANGGIDSWLKAEECLNKTGCAAVMIATAALSNPELLKWHECTASESDEIADNIGEGSTACSEASFSQLNTSHHPEDEKLQRALRHSFCYLEFCQAHPPWALRPVKDHLRALLSPVCKDLEAVELVGKDAGPSPVAIGAEDARSAFWQDICQQFRDALEEVRTSSCQFSPPKDNARSGNNVPSARCLTKQALGRAIPAKMSYVEEERRKAAALRSCMSALSSRTSRSAKR